MLDDTSSSSSDMVLTLGDIVMLTDYDSEKFIVCQGWYTWEGTRRNGWYFKSIADGTIVPDFEIDMDDITIVSSNSSSSSSSSSNSSSCTCGCSSSNSSNNSSNSSSDSTSNGDTDMKYLPEDELMELLRGTFLTVDTIEERNKLSLPYPPDGKIIRVNDVKDEVKYYVWNAERLGWDDFLFPPEIKEEPIIEFNWEYME